MNEIEAKTLKEIELIKAKTAIAVAVINNVEKIALKSTTNSEVNRMLKSTILEIHSTLN